jgi:hypothetical protein
MSATPPIWFNWDGEAMVPKHPRIADKHFVVGEPYCLVPHEERSVNSHRHYFAAINEAWSNLPEDLVEQFPTPERLRKYALVRAGYADERSIVCASKAEAQRVAAFIRPMDQYAVVTVSESVVRVYTPQSQSMRAMGKKAFQESKDKVLNVIAQMIGVSAETLASEARRAA